MTLTIGRAVLDCVATPMHHSGDRVTFDISIDPSWTTGVAHAKALRQQILGLAGNADEPVVPVMWTDDSDLTGFYRVVSTSLTPFVMYLVTGQMHGTVELERVGGGWAKPMFQVATLGVVLANDHGETGRARVGVPTLPGSTLGTEVDLGFNPGGDSQNAATATGSVLVAGSTSLPFSNVASFFVPPAMAYGGSALIEVSMGGSWYPLIGRQVPQLTPGGWRVSNGRLRLTPQTVSGSKVCLVEWWTVTDGYLPLIELEVGFINVSTWVSRYFGLTSDDGTGDFAQPTILRNSPECVSVLLPAHGGAAQTVTLRRGERHATVALTSPTGTTRQHGLGSLTAVASTDGTSHVRRTTAVSNRQFFIATPRNNGVDTTNGRISIDAATRSATFMVGNYATGTGSQHIASALTACVDAQMVVAR